MLGVILTGLYDLVEETFGLEVLDEMIVSSDLANDGIYSGIGTYPHSDMVRLVQNLSLIVNITSEELMRIYGAHLFKFLMKSHSINDPMLANCFDLLSQLDTLIHVQVRKLYPQAEVPAFSYELIAKDTMRLVYCSDRPFASVAHGLIEGSGAYFGEQLIVTREPEKEQSPCHAVFIIKNISLSEVPNEN